MVRFFHFGLTCSKQRLGLSLSCATDKRYFVSSGATSRRDPKSVYSFAQIFALRRSETPDSRSKVLLEKSSSGFSSMDNFSLPSELDFMMSSISVHMALSTTLDILCGKYRYLDLERPSQSQSHLRDALTPRRRGLTGLLIIYQSSYPV